MKREAKSSDKRLLGAITPKGRDFRESGLFTSISISLSESEDSSTVSTSCSSMSKTVAIFDQVCGKNDDFCSANRTKSLRIKENPRVLRLYHFAPTQLLACRLTLTLLAGRAALPPPTLPAPSTGRTVWHPGQRPFRKNFFLGFLKIMEY